GTRNSETIRTSANAGPFQRAVTSAWPPGTGPGKVAAYCADSQPAQPCHTVHAVASTICIQTAASPSDAWGWPDKIVYVVKEEMQR
ncbi:MAG: hypothetical protein QF773_04395, partial [Lentisphaeria bacterium]|nr:hypothetical protein [Lentisphaeria bacterium]